MLNHEPRCSSCGCPVNIGELSYPHLSVCAPQAVIGLLCRTCLRMNVGLQAQAPLTKK